MGRQMNRPTPRAIPLAGGGRQGGLFSHLPPGSRYQGYPFYAGFLLIIIWFSEEFARTLG
jgi:hypothetical protein